MLYLAAPINGQSLIFNNIELVIKETLLPNMKNPSLSIKYTIYLNYFGAETCPSGHLFFPVCLFKHTYWYIHNITTLFWTLHFYWDNVKKFAFLPDHFLDITMTWNIFSKTFPWHFQQELTSMTFPWHIHFHDTWQPWFMTFFKKKFKVS